MVWTTIYVKYCFDIFNDSSMENAQLLLIHKKAVGGIIRDLTMLVRNYINLVKEQLRLFVSLQQNFFAQFFLQGYLATICL